MKIETVRQFFIKISTLKILVDLCLQGNRAILIVAPQGYELTQKQDKTLCLLLHIVSEMFVFGTLTV
jgi:hypothetical protein